MTTTYRFVGDAPEVFLDLAGVITVAGVDREAPTWRDGEPNPDHQPPGELRPGQEFELPDGVTVHHARVERKDGRRWVPSVEPDEAPFADPEPVAGAGDAAGITEEA